MVSICWCRLAFLVLTGTKLVHLHFRLSVRVRVVQLLRKKYVIFGGLYRTTWKKINTQGNTENPRMYIEVLRGLTGNVSCNDFNTWSLPILIDLSSQLKQLGCPLMKNNVLAVQSIGPNEDGMDVSWSKCCPAKPCGACWCCWSFVHLLPNSECWWLGFGPKFS